MGTPFKKTQDFLFQLRNLGQNLSDYELKEASRILNQIRRQKYQSGRKPICDGVNRTFSYQDLQQFFMHLLSEKYALLFMFQMTLALRIGEVVLLNVYQLDFVRQTILVYEPKTNKVIDKKIPSELFERLLKFIEANRFDIKTHQGYIFFSNAPKNKKIPRPHLSKDYMRTIFRETIVKAGLDKKYATSAQGNKLNILSTHSFRKTGISRMAEALRGDIFKLKLYSGHKTVRSLEVYVQHAVKEEVNQKVDEVFGSEGNMIDKLKKFFE